MEQVLLQVRVQRNPSRPRVATSCRLTRFSKLRVQMQKALLASSLLNSVGLEQPRDWAGAGGGRRVPRRIWVRGGDGGARLARGLGRGFKRRPRPRAGQGGRGDLGCPGARGKGPQQAQARPRGVTRPEAMAAPSPPGSPPLLA
ncbi:Hypothetical predicted protein [Podarcis lilfordi]|uniref:Uncharacterized protein n=1 Tax=Podarcis lilfordi TaxID=74358 RepID=A0AA35KVN8_9SAUR|nr:Hypothetical predicted protein [Podarcis lilfordi]